MHEAQGVGEQSVLLRSLSCSQSAELHDAFALCLRARHSWGLVPRDLSCLLAQEHLIHPFLGLSTLGCVRQAYTADTFQEESKSNW